MRLVFGGARSPRPEGMLRPFREPSGRAPDPRATLAAHEEEVDPVALVGCVSPVSGRAPRIENRNHDITRPAPDAGPGLGAHLDDVLAEGAASKLEVIARRQIIPAASTPAAPL